MKCREVMERAVDPVAAVECEEISAHLESCEACRRQLEVFRVLQRTIALKRYERRLEQRGHLCAQAVRHRVGALHAAPVGIPPLRLFVLMASGIVLMIGVYFAVHLLHHLPEDTTSFALEEDAELHAQRDLSEEPPLITDFMNANRPFWDRMLWDNQEAQPHLPRTWVDEPIMDIGPRSPEGAGYRILTGFE